MNRSETISTPQLNETGIMQARKSKLLGELITIDEVKEFKKALSRISQALGIHNVPDAEYLSGLTLFLQRHFGRQITSQELSYAFELYATGRIVINEKREHFSSLTFPFVSAVLNAYLQFREPVLNFEISQQKLLEPPAGPEMTFEEWGKWTHELISKYMQENKKLNLLADWATAYKYLETAGEITIGLDEKKQYVADFKISETKRLSDRRGSFQLDEHTFRSALAALEDKKNLAWLCRRELAIEYYKKKLNLLINKPDEKTD